MTYWIGLTHNKWFRFLREHASFDEVNFWQPKASRRPKRLKVGDLFLFKLHAPENFIVGGGYFSHYSPEVPLSVAWDTFGEENGAGDFPALLGMVRGLRSDQDPDPRVGCIILADPFYFIDEDWISSEGFWKRGVQQGFYMDTDSVPGRKLFSLVAERVPRASITLRDEVGEEFPDVFGKPTLVRPRRGQGSFRFLITDTYERHCAISHERALPVLEAAHIKAVSEGGQHRVDNGLLLRSDIHKLFDAGYITVAPDYKIHVSHKLKDDFDNGEPYYPFDKKELWLPPSDLDRPSREFLEEHADTKFRG